MMGRVKVQIQNINLAWVKARIPKSTQGNSTKVVFCYTVNILIWPQFIRKIDDSQNGVIWKRIFWEIIRFKGGNKGGVSGGISTFVDV